MTQLPSPLTSPDCDLRDFPFMPLDVVRLRDSDLAALETPEACWAAVLLWCASWHQVPAASLPDDDRVLANLAGFGRVVKEWQRIRDGALRGWVKCSDGRLYHPVVADKANDAWESRVAFRDRKEAERVRKAEERARKAEEAKQKAKAAQESAGEHPADNGGVSGGQNKDVQRTDGDCPADNGGVSLECPPENALRGKGTGDRDSGEGQGEGEYLKTRAAQDSGSSSPSPGESAAPPAYEQLATQLQKAGVSITSSHPNVIAWVGRGVTSKQAADAVAIARQRKPDGPIPANYLVPIIEEILNPPAASTTKTSGAWRFSDEATLAKGKELGLEPYVGELMEPYRQRLSIEIERRKAA